MKETAYKILVDKLKDGILILDLKGKIMYANPAMEELFDIPLAKSKGTFFMQYLTKKSVLLAMGAFAKTVRGKESLNLEAEAVHSDGHLIPVECNAVPLIEEGKQTGVLVSVRNLTGRKKMIQQLEASERKHRELFENANDAIFIADIETGQILDANKQAEKLLGRTKEEIKKMNQYELHPEDKREQYVSLFKKHINERSSQTAEAEVVRKDGIIVPVDISAGVIRIDDKEVIQGVFRDISLLKKLKQEKEQAERSSLIDFHTQLFNYRYLQKRLVTEFASAKRYLAPLSLLMMDIDYFKSINDTYGHQFGDEVLRQFAALLSANAREVDIVCRFGGEEFIIILTNTDSKGAVRFAKRLQDSIKDHTFKIIGSKYSVKLKVSMGIASYPEDAMKTSTALLNAADRALVASKGAESGSICLFGQVRQEPFDSIIEEAGKQRVDTLRKKFTNLSKRMNQTVMESVYALARAVGAKDDYTERHSEEMADYAVKIAKRFKLTKDETEDVRNGAMLHDIGKIGTSDKILLKKGKLTEAEQKEIKKHSQIGADIVRQVHFLKNVVPIILHHHERYDGFGYGSGLKGDDIPLGARIIAIVDVYQALISDRPYRKAYSKKEAEKIVRNGAGSFFDPKVAEVFLDILKKEK